MTRKQKRPRKSMRGRSFVVAVISERADHRTASAGAGDANRAAVVPDKRGHSVQRNMGNPGSPFRRRSGSRAHRGGPSASGKSGHSDQAGWSCPRFPGWGALAQGGAAEQAGPGPADRPDPDAKIRRDQQKRCEAADWGSPLAPVRQRRADEILVRQGLRPLALPEQVWGQEPQALPPRAPLAQQAERQPLPLL